MQQDNIMRRSMTKESSWAVLDIIPDGVAPDNAVSKRMNRPPRKALPTLNEDSATTSVGDLPKIDETSGFKSSQITPVPSDLTSKTARREQMSRMSSWACMGMDDL